MGGQPRNQFNIRQMKGLKSMNSSNEAQMKKHGIIKHHSNLS